jgi:hypothetical protein
MQRIGIDQLRSLWKQQGIYGSWREILKSDYQPGELYFEFGLMPEKSRQNGDYRIVLDHEVHVQLVPPDVKLSREYIIRPDASKAGKREVDTTHRYHTLFVTPTQYTGMVEDASRIYEEYKDDDIVCFWSIPNKWFADCSLVQFLTDEVVLTEDYKKRISTRQDWYWP